MQIQFRALVLILASLLAGCASSDRHGQREAPPPSITDATWTPGRNDLTVITGQFFKVNSDNKNDVLTSLNGRNWVPASKIVLSSGTLYHVTLPYGPGFPQVWVRIYGINETYSEPALVHSRVE